MLTRCQHLAGPAQLGASSSSRGDRSPGTSAPHRRPNRTCVIGEVPDQPPFDLADGDWYPSSRTGSRAGALTRAMSRQVPVFDNAERCQSGLSEGRVKAGPILIDHTCAHRDDPSRLHGRTRVEVALAADLKTAHLT